MRAIVTNTLSAVASVAITIGIVGFSSPAQADAPSAPLTQRVHYDQRELATPGGRSAVAQRITAAAEQVCRPFQGVDRFSEMQCRAKAVVAADTALDAQATEFASR